MIEDFAKDFWAQRAAATHDTIRWTADEMLDFDAALVARELRGGESLIDLGCGTGDLALAVLDRVDHVTLVDMIADFLDRIPEDPRITKEVSDLGTYQSDQVFDIGLLFGVVTHLSEAAENEVYALLRRLVPRGVVIVKNQCGVDETLEIDTMSAEFESRYQARYPAILEQAERLRDHFEEVTTVRYPSTFNKWENSAHVAFICR